MVTACMAGGAGLGGVLGLVKFGSRIRDLLSDRQSRPGRSIPRKLTEALPLSALATSALMAILREQSSMANITLG